MSGRGTPEPGAAPSGRRAPGPMFLEREGYRRRRITDAVRLLPVLGAGLYAVPLLWPGAGTSSASALHYIFGAWVVLIVLTGVLARAVRRAGWRAPDDAPR